MASIDYFKSKIQEGLARPNRFAVSISIPRYPGFSRFGQDNVVILCDSASLPTSAITTQDDTMWGPGRKIPYNKAYDDLRLSFLCTTSMNERAFFDQWQALVINPSEFFVNYYDQYTADITVTTLDEQDFPTYTIRCIEAYPLSVNAQELNSAETDTFLRLDVNFAYRYWVVV